jgi:phage shock protein A
VTARSNESSTVREIGATSKAIPAPLSDSDIRWTPSFVAEELARQRIGSLEDDVTAYRALAHAALENIAHLTARNKRLAERIDNLIAQLREIMAAPCLDCRRSKRRSA